MWCCWWSYGAHSGRVARVILVSTVLSFLSFPIAVAWMLPKYCLRLLHKA